MTVHTLPEPAPVAATGRPRIENGHDSLVSELVDSLRPRLPEVAPADLPGLVRAALDDLGEARVTTYLPILVERRIRDGRRAV